MTTTWNDPVILGGGRVVTRLEDIVTTYEMSTELKSPKAPPPRPTAPKKDSMKTVKLKSVHMLHPDPLTAVVELTPESYPLTRHEAILLPPGSGRGDALEVYLVERQGEKRLLHLRQPAPDGFASQESFYALAQTSARVRAAAYHPDLRQTMRKMLDAKRPLAVVTTVFHEGVSDNVSAGQAQAA